MQKSERRAAQRVVISKPLVVQGTNVDGKSFCEETASINVSSSGIYFQLDQPVDEHAILDVAVVEKEGRRNTCHKARGRVVRREAVVRHELSGTDLRTTHLAIEFLQSLHLALSLNEASARPLSMKMASGRAQK